MLFGPMLGGKLLNTSSAAGFATPFYWSFAASVAVLLLVAFFFSETRQADNKLATSPVEAFAGFKRIAYVFQIKGIRRLLIAWVVFMLGWDFYMQYFSNYLLGVLHFDPNQIGNFFSYLGIAYLVAQIAIVQPSTRFFSAKKMLVPAGVVVAACIFAIGLVESVSLVYLLITIYIVAIGLFIPNFNAMLSDRADQQHQGVAFGACVSLHALTTLTMALIGGVLLTFSLRLPLVGGGILIFLGCIIFYCFTRRNSAESK
jgi:predicted MFS family arabinose efflux permease